MINLSSRSRPARVIRAAGLLAATASLAVGLAGPATATAVGSGTQTGTVQSTGGVTDATLTLSPGTVTGNPGDTTTVTLTVVTSNAGLTGIAFGGPGLTQAQALAAIQSGTITSPGGTVSISTWGWTCTPDPAVTGQYGNQNYYDCVIAPNTTIPNFSTLTINYPITVPATPNSPGATVSDFSAGVNDPHSASSTTGAPVVTGTVVEAAPVGTPVVNIVVGSIALGLIAAAVLVVRRRRRASALTA